MGPFRRSQPEVEKPDYVIHAGMLVSGDNELGREVAIEMGMRAYLIRCQILKLDMNDNSTAPVLWWLNPREMQLIREALAKSNDPAAIALCDQIEVVMKSIKMEEAAA